MTILENRGGDFVEYRLISGTAAPCPECKSREFVQLSNSYTSYYRIGCARCRIEVADTRPAGSQSMATHRRSAHRVADRWNRLFGGVA